MSTVRGDHSAPLVRQPDLARGVLQRGAQVVGTLLFYGALLFVSAGSLDWPAAWIFLGIGAAVIIANASILLSKDPAFVAARGRVREDAKDWDKQVTALAGLGAPGAATSDFSFDRISAAARTGLGSTAAPPPAVARPSLST